MTIQVEKLVTDMHPALTRHEASVESDRCYFCHDAPCVTACPTGIDIPMFIRQINAGNPKSAAATIFSQNIFGGMCARDCPTETLCEQACVRNTAEEQPVRIGELQRYATDILMDTGEQPFARAAASGKRVAVVGAGPAGLACAHRLATQGHDIVVFDARKKAGGLNEYGIAAYKTVDDFARREVEYICSIGGITIESEKQLGKDVELAQLVDDFDAVFLGIGLAGVNELGIEEESVEGVADAVSFIADLRQAEDFDAFTASIGKPQDVVVIGGGMTAIDAAMQSRLLGADNVTIAYRRGFEHMNASELEQHLAQTHGVSIKPWLQPKAIKTEQGKVSAVEFAQMKLENGKLVETGNTRTIPADRVYKAIGQSLSAEALSMAGLEIEKNRIAVNEERRTGHPSIWAGGDCVAISEDLTVAAVQDGKLAAESINSALS